MDQDSPSRSEVMMAGIGGMGVLVAGRLLASAGLRRYQHVSWMPAYGEARRGGPSECTVVMSHEEIASPILDQVQTVMLLDGSQLKNFESRVRPGGLLIVESAGLQDKPQRGDFTFLPVSGLEIAMVIGGILVNNLILLGVYTEVMKPLPSKLIEEELQKTYGGREAILKRNLDAFRTGIDLAKTAAT